MFAVRAYFETSFSNFWLVSKHGFEVFVLLEASIRSASCPKSL
jgi:hypothetical protein